jgi:hypothetical protein
MFILDLHGKKSNSANNCNEAHLIEFRWVVPEMKRDGGRTLQHAATVNGYIIIYYNIRYRTVKLKVWNKQ